MSWTVRILMAEAPFGATVFDVVATSEATEPNENPDLLIASYTNRLQALVAARRYDAARRATLQTAVVLPFPERGSAA